MPEMQCFTDRKHTPSYMIAVCRRQSASDISTIGRHGEPMDGIETSTSRALAALLDPGDDFDPAILVVTSCADRSPARPQRADGL
jgi:hypothetical protein